MTVGDLKQLLDGLDDDMEVVTGEYNGGYGGYFFAGAEVVTLDEGDGGDASPGVRLVVGPRFG